MEYHKYRFDKIHSLNRVSYKYIVFSSKKRDIYFYMPLFIDIFFWVLYYFIDNIKIVLFD